MTRLRWAPPAQQAPVVVKVPPTYYTGTFAPDQDVTFLWPNTPRWSSFSCTGGRHVRIVGGQAVKTTAGAAVNFVGVTGSVFLEGLAIDMGGISADAIDVGGSPTAPWDARPDVYVQNCRIVGVTGSHAGIHADILQPQGAVGGIYVDGLTGSTDYQGLFLPPQKPIDRIELHRVNLSYNPGVDHVTYLLWLADDGATTYTRVTLDDVWLEPRPEQALTDTFYPPTRDLARINVRGSVRCSLPPHADFVPAGSVGLGYVSPGYA